VVYAGSQLFPSDEKQLIFYSGDQWKMSINFQSCCENKKSIIPDDPVMFFCAGTRKKMAIFILKCERKNFQTFSPVEVDRTWSSPPPQTCARLRSSVPSKSFHSHTHTQHNTHSGRGEERKRADYFETTSTISNRDQWDNNHQANLLGSCVLVCELCAVFVR
jgi:hypothetical protein